MKNQVWQKWVAVSALSVLLAACGGGGGSDTPAPISSKASISSVVSFGDSLSDAGTYVAAKAAGGGKFTTNPGKVWVENVAAYYGITIVPAETSGFGVPTTTNPNGYAYGQGGSRVSDPNGINHAGGATTLPITSQMANYLTNHTAFNAKQLVLIQGGPNDIFTHLAILGAGGETQNAAQTAIITAATQLVGVVQTAATKGAQYIVVAGVPDMGSAPLFAGNPTGAAGATSLSLVFNTALQTGLGQLKAALPSTIKIIYIDAFTYIDYVAAHSADPAFGFKHSLDAVACDAAKINAIAPTAGGSSLFCSANTLTEAGADQTYMFADGIHPTTRLHSLISDYVIGRVEAAFNP
ncbi:SGNH/GDSL hydrolase family protein [Andreprevotia chitinilytica]|uniref:SGNH/GDSL hydrolase family protein n=1 Tax=Andreprevotia chitinilytica TaxID=396808 RepID=UPI00068F2AAB|nr:SGNH/GDSL hydrolase family protein [Andreprevotia chitinilytica]